MGSTVAADGQQLTTLLMSPAALSYWQYFQDVLQIEANNTIKGITADLPHSVSAIVESSPLWNRCLNGAHKCNHCKIFIKMPVGGRGLPSFSVISIVRKGI